MPDPDILNGIHLIYDYQFDASEKIFKDFVAGSPDRPEGYFYLSMVTWCRLASGFWGPDMVKQYVRRVDRTVRVARKRIETIGGDSYDHFYLGGALGFKGRFELSRGHYLSAFFSAVEAIDRLKRCQEMDPDNRDVLLGLGIFDYYTARLSGVLKFLSYLLIHRGDKEEGLRKLQVAAAEAPYSGTEAKSMLLHIYLFLEARYQKALNLCAEMIRRFPHNPRYRFLYGVCHIHLERDQAYRETVAWLEQKGRHSASPHDAALWLNRALYLEAVYDLFNGAYMAARSKLKTILDRAFPDEDPSMIAWPLVKIGMSHDLEGEREKALSYYEKILRMKNGAGAQFLVKKLLEEPPAKDDPFIGY